MKTARRKLSRKKTCKIEPFGYRPGRDVLGNSRRVAEPAKFRRIQRLLDHFIVVIGSE
jgi:hypothetical protein